MDTKDLITSFYTLIEKDRQIAGLESKCDMLKSDRDVQAKAVLELERKLNATNTFVDNQNKTIVELRDKLAEVQAARAREIGEDEKLRLLLKIDELRSELKEENLHWKNRFEKEEADHAKTMGELAEAQKLPDDYEAVVNQNEKLTFEKTALKEELAKWKYLVDCGYENADEVVTELRKRDEHTEAVAEERDKAIEELKELRKDSEAYTTPSLLNAAEKYESLAAKAKAVWKSRWQTTYIRAGANDNDHAIVSYLCLKNLAADLERGE